MTVMNWKQLLIWIARFVVLVVLYYIFFLLGTFAIRGAVSDVQSEPGLVSNELGLLIIGFSNAMIILALILSSQWRGKKLMLALALSYYGAVTFLTQIETWYFLNKLTVDEELIVRLLLMGVPIAFIYVPIAVWILGKGRLRKHQNIKISFVSIMSYREWFGRLLAIAFIYVFLYWTAGYFIAWQNPILRTFYGAPEEIVPFFQHTKNTLLTDPAIFPFQFLRGIIWVACSIPILFGTRIHVFWKSILLGLFFTVPQSLGLLIENPLMPNASVRFSHLIEVGISNFIFSLFIILIFNLSQRSNPDRFSKKHSIP
jgi:hypothetical protein